MDMHPSEILASFVADTDSTALSASTRTAAKRVVLDATGVMLSASGMAEACVPFVELARASGQGAAAILGTGYRVPPAAAALANGAFAHALDFEDAFDLSPGHPNASLMPALLALAQVEGPVSGERFLAALAVGCDVACRMALATRQRLEVGGWYPPPIYAGYGAAAGAASLLGLDAQQVRDAISFSLCQVTMPGELKYSADTQLRAVREAFPAQAAVNSVFLARAGLRGLEQPLEGRSGFYALYADGNFSAETLADRLGEKFWIEDLTFKPWPSCRGTHAFIEMALEMQQRHAIAPADIERMICAVGEYGSMLFEPESARKRPPSSIEAKFSIPFTLGLALTRGKVALDDFGAEDLRDPAILALAAITEPDYGTDGTRPSDAGGTLTIILKSGDIHTMTVDDPRGCPGNPLTDEQLVAKFIDCAGRARNPLDTAAAASLADAILSLENCDDVGALLAL